MLRLHSFEYICIRFLIHAMHTKGDLTQGGITGTLLRFTLPMIAGAMLQQCYNVADTLIVGRFVGPEALAAVGSAYTLMVFITSILLGLSMGSGTVVSLKFGAGDHDGMDLPRIFRNPQPQHHHQGDQRKQRKYIHSVRIIGG